MGSFVGPRRAKSWRADDWAGLAGRTRIRAYLRKPGCGYAANPAFNCRIISSIAGAGPVRMLTARQRGASATGTTPQSCDPTPPAWQALTRVMPATSSGPGVVSPASMRADTALITRSG
jgi:hypothetical protein